MTAQRHPGAGVPAILLGGGPIAVPVARSLGGSGTHVYALGVASDPVRHSRHCAEFRDFGTGVNIQGRWLDWLLSADSPRGVILPCNDDGLELVARHRPELVRLGYRPVEGNDEVILAMLDKHRTYALARQAGVPVPRTALIGEMESVPEAVAGLDFPCALKPRHSHHFQRHFGLNTKVVVVNNMAELHACLERVRALGLEMLVTEIIPGADDAYHSYYTFIDEHGEPLLHLTKRTLRQYPPGFGLATYHVTHHDPEAIELGLRFVRAIGLRGVANVQFKRDPRDGRLKLIECNHRFTAGHEVIRHAGIDLALIAYNRLTGRPLPRLNGYRTGVRMWHPVEDTRGFLELRRRGQLDFRQWLASLAHRQHFPLLSWRDPAPSLRSWSRFALRLIGSKAR